MVMHDISALKGLLLMAEDGEGLVKQEFREVEEEGEEGEEEVDVVEVEVEVGCLNALETYQR